MATPHEPDPYDIAFEELIPARGQMETEGPRRAA